MKKSMYKKVTRQTANAYTYVKPLKKYAHKVSRQAFKKMCIAP